MSSLLGLLGVLVLSDERVQTTEDAYLCSSCFCSHPVPFLRHGAPSLRSPGAVTPRDVACEGFSLTYPRIAESSSALSAGVDQKVDDAIESFLRTLSQIGPELLSGCLTLSFFERRATRQLFGLVSHEERVVYVCQSVVCCCHGTFECITGRPSHSFLLHCFRQMGAVDPASGGKQYTETHQQRQCFGD